jgi:hypothetical protein
VWDAQSTLHTKGPCSGTAPWAPKRRKGCGYDIRQNRLFLPERTAVRIERSGILQTVSPNKTHAEMLRKRQPSHFGQFFSYYMDKFVPKASRGLDPQAERGMDFPEFGLSNPLICKILEGFCGKWKSLVWMDSAVQT